jgi:predicted MPP superfamily phosphohydrolase
MGFFTTFIALYILLNAYVYFRGFSALADKGWWVVALKVLFIALAVAFPILHSLEDEMGGPVLDTINLIGSLWVAAVLYFFMLAILLDVTRLIDRLVPIVPRALRQNRVLLGRTVFFGSIALVFLLIFSGWLNTRFVRVEKLQVDLASLPKAHNPTTLVFASDLHIGSVIGQKRLSAFVDDINAEHPDVVLIGGDLIEGSIPDPDGTASILSRIDAPRGVFAVLGNHEFHADPDKAAAFMRSAGITVLRDDLVTIPGVVNIVGLDYHRTIGNTGAKAAPLSEILKRRDPRLPTILLYHAPVNLEEYAALPIDLMLSGHSHHGQFFPLTLVTDLVYEVSYGYGKIGSMNLYVTSGLGTWGPPVRILTHPEIVRITLVNHGGKD